MELEPRARHEQRRLDLEKASPLEERAQLAQHPRALAQPIEPQPRQAHDLAAGRRIIAARPRARDALVVDQVAGLPPGPCGQPRIATLATHDSDIAIDREHPPFHRRSRSS